jgi:hypothetical protein
LAQTETTPTVVDLATILTPFLLLATAIERTWEAIFDTLEKAAMSGGRLIGVSADSVKWMHDELANAQAAANQVAQSFALDPTNPVFQQRLALAEARLRDARLRLEELPKEPRYVAVKRATTIFGSLVAGVVISIISQQLFFFRTLGFAIPPAADMLLTGLIIGTGPGPVHSLIGTLQSLRDTLSAVGNLAQGAAIKNAALGTQTAVETAAMSTPATKEVLPPPATKGLAPEEQEQPIVTVETTLSLQRKLQQAVRSR